MINRLKSLRLTVFAFSFIILSLLPVATVGAAQSASLSITPKKNYTIEPGKTVNDTLTIRNIDKTHTLNLQLRVVDFTFSDDTGTPKLMLDESAPQTTWSLKPFMKIPKKVTIKPNETKTVDMSIVIPAEHGAGSYYSAIVYSSGADDGSGTVGLSASGVTLAFVTIPGEVHEDLNLKKLGAYDRAASKYRFFNTSMPDTIAYTLENKGNVTESPVGSIVIKDLFGRERTIQNINPNGSLALIGQTRTFMSCLKLKSETADFNGVRSEANSCTSPNIWPGLYTVDLSAYYGQNGNRTRNLTGTAHFLYLPVWFIIVVILALALIIYHGRRFVLYVRGKRSGTGSSRRRSIRKQRK